MSLVFYDPICPVAYSNDTLRHSPLGGTEATVVRVAEALGAEVMQHNRLTAEGWYQPPYESRGVRNVVLLRKVEELPKMREMFPNAKLHLWLHDLCGRELIDHADKLVAAEATIICVSDFHLNQCKDILRQAGPLPGVTVKRVYNPIEEDLQPDATVVDPNKLVFFSSPHKGIAWTLQVFQYLRNVAPEMRLYVANPGYFTPEYPKPEGVVDLGPLPHHEVIKHVRSALCTFYLNNVFPETFGLVLAESNAVGTPVITAPIGAAREVLYHPSELLDVRDYRAVIQRVLAWRSGVRPRVRGKKEFRMDAVASAWRRVLG